MAPPHTPGQTEILAASATGIGLLGQTVQGQAPSCVAPASGSSGTGSHVVGGGESTIKLGSH